MVMVQEPASQRGHAAASEGVALGLLVATVIWVWIALVDGFVGEPFRTFDVLGGVVTFTALHYALNVAYGIVMVAAVHGAAREPRVLVGVALVSFIIELAFVMFTIFLSNAGLGELAWLRVLGGNVAGAVTAFLFLARRHPLREEFQAEVRVEKEDA